MECRDVRALEDTYLDEELLVETNHALLAHLRNCPACNEELHRRRALRTTLKSAFGSDPRLAPRADFAAMLAAALHAQAERATATTWRRYLPWMAAAAAVAMAFAIEWGRASRIPTQMPDDAAIQPLIESAVGDHRDCALGHQPSEPPVPLDQAAYDTALRGLDNAVRVSAMALESPADTIGAHACIWQGRRFGHVVLSFKGAVVSVLVTNPPRDVARYAAAVPTRCPTTAEFSVECFAAPQHAVFVVSDLPANESATLAQQLAPGIRNHLSRVLALLQPLPGP
jgi:anti-sigma factor RsiW